MRRKIFIALICIFALSTNAQSYVDLGLPSGTLWKNKNEPGDFYSYKQAVEKFGDNLPATWQWNELQSKCIWEWTGNGYTISGKNGNSIFLPAAGCRTPQGYVKRMGARGYYWAFTPAGIDGAMMLFLMQNEVRVVEDTPDAGCTVRLVR